MSYPATLRIITRMGEKFDEDVQKWKAMIKKQESKNKQEVRDSLKAKKRIG